MPKWFKYLIVVAIGVFAICLVVDIALSGNMVQSKESIGQMGKAACLFTAFLMYAICAACVAGMIQINSIPKLKELVREGCPVSSLGAPIATGILFLFATGLLLAGLGIISIPR